MYISGTGVSRRRVSSSKVIKNRCLFISLFIIVSKVLSILGNEKSDYPSRFVEWREYQNGRPRSIINLAVWLEKQRKDRRLKYIKLVSNNDHSAILVWFMCHPKDNQHTHIISMRNTHCKNSYTHLLSMRNTHCKINHTKMENTSENNWSFKSSEYEILKENYQIRQMFIGKRNANHIFMHIHSIK